MKWLGVILLSGYFLAREKEAGSQDLKKPTTLLRDGIIFIICSGAAVACGVFFWQLPRGILPAILLLAAAAPVILLKGRPVCMIAGSAIAFCVLRFMPDMSHALLALVCADALVFVTALLYQGARIRMMFLCLPSLTQKTAGRLLILFSLSVLLTVVYQKMIQLF